MSFEHLTTFEYEKKYNAGIMFFLHARSERLRAQEAGNPPANTARSLKRRRLSVSDSLFVCLLSKTTPKSKRRRCEAKRRPRTTQKAEYGLAFQRFGAGGSCILFASILLPRLASRVIPGISCRLSQIRIDPHRKRRGRRSRIARSVPKISYISWLNSGNC